MGTEKLASQESTRCCSSQARTLSGRTLLTRSHIFVFFFVCFFLQKEGSEGENILLENAGFTVSSRADIF